MFTYLRICNLYFHFIFRPVEVHCGDKFSIVIGYPDKTVKTTEKNEKRDSNFLLLNSNSKSNNEINNQSDQNENNDRKSKFFFILESYSEHGYYKKINDTLQRINFNESDNIDQNDILSTEVSSILLSLLSNSSKMNSNHYDKQDHSYGIECSLKSYKYLLILFKNNNFLSDINEYNNLINDLYSNNKSENDNRKENNKELNTKKDFNAIKNDLLKSYGPLLDILIILKSNFKVLSMKLRKSKLDNSSSNNMDGEHQLNTLNKNNENNTQLKESSQILRDKEIQQNGTSPATPTIPLSATPTIPLSAIHRSSPGLTH